MKSLLTFCAGAVIFAFGTVGVGSEDRSEDANAPIVLDRCRIKLIDQVTLASDRPGVLAFVEPEEGVSVKKDQRVAGLDDRVALAKKRVAEKEVENDINIRFAKKAFEVADTEHKKMVQANKGRPSNSPVFVEMEVLKAKLQADRADLQIEQAEHEFEIAKRRLDEATADWETYQIIAPFDGVVTHVHKRQGEAVRQGDPILEISNTERVRVEGEVPLRDAYRVRQGMLVEVQLDVPGVQLKEEEKVFIGRVVFVNPEAEGINKTLKVYATVENPDNVLKTGLTAKMTILPDTFAEADEGE